MVPLYYLPLDLDPQLRQEAERWVRRFSAFLALPPYSAPSEVRLVDQRLEELLHPALEEDSLPGMAASACEILFDLEDRQTGERPPPRLIVVCGPDSTVAQKSKAGNPDALWGGSVGCLAVVYRHEPTVVWHEMFHLFGAKDCYREEAPDESALPLCGEERCIMQYAPALGKVGDPPFLCAANVERVAGPWRHPGT